MPLYYEYFDGTRLLGVDLCRTEKKRSTLVSKSLPEEVGEKDRPLQKCSHLRGWGLRYWSLPRSGLAPHVWTLILTPVSINSVSVLAHNHPNMFSNLLNRCCLHHMNIWVHWPHLTVVLNQSQSKLRVRCIPLTATVSSSVRVTAQRIGCKVSSCCLWITEGYCMILDHSCTTRLQPSSDFTHKSNR